MGLGDLGVGLEIPRPHLREPSSSGCALQSRISGAVERSSSSSSSSAASKQAATAVKRDGGWDDGGEPAGQPTSQCVREPTHPLPELPY